MNYVKQYTDIYYVLRVMYIYNASVRFAVNK